MAGIHIACPAPPPLVVTPLCPCSLPVLLPSIQERLLDALSLILAKKPYRPPPAAAAVARSPSLGSPGLQTDLTAAGLTQLALRTLGTFDLGVSHFGGCGWNGWISESVRGTCLRRILMGSRHLIVRPGNHQSLGSSARWCTANKAATRKKMGFLFRSRM